MIAQTGENNPERINNNGDRLFTESAPGVLDCIPCRCQVTLHDRGSWLCPVLRDVVGDDVNLTPKAWQGG